MEHVIIKLNFPYRLSTFPYVIKFVYVNGFGKIIVGEGDFAYSINLPNGVIVSNSSLKFYGGYIFLNIVFHESFIEVYISSG